MIKAGLIALVAWGCFGCGDDSAGSGGTGGSGGVAGSGGTGGMAGSGATGGMAGTGGSGGMAGTGGTGGMAGSGGTGGTGPSIHTVFLILFEDHDWSTIMGSSSAPYINGMLLPMASHASNYRTPPGNHPSEPNYIWLEAGDNLGITNDGPPSTNAQTTTSHLVTLLNAQQISWRSWQEDMTANTCPTTDSGLYVAHHNPMVFFTDVTGTANGATYCQDHIRPYSEFAGALTNNTVARYNFITPNLCHDMGGTGIGGSCGSLTDLVHAADTWLSTEIPRIMASQAYQQGGAVFITWDEGSAAPGGTASDGPMGMIVVSPFAKGNGYANTIAYGHSSTLKTIQEIFNVTPLLRDAGSATVTDLRDLFTTFP